MTDDRRPRMRPTRSGGAVFWHPCSVCGYIHAPYGKGVDLRKEKFGVWFCKDHLPAESEKTDLFGRK